LQNILTGQPLMRDNGLSRYWTIVKIEVRNLEYRQSQSWTTGQAE
jgi:hypothetical protein